MKTLFLVLWFASGMKITEGATPDDCKHAFAEASYVLAIDGYLADEHGDPIVRIDCGEKSNVLMLPASDMPCEVGA